MQRTVMAPGRWAARVRGVTVGIGLVLAAGCTTYTRHECWGLPPTEIHLRLAHSDGGPARSLVRVRGLEFDVVPDAEGRGVFTIPPLLGGRTWVNGVLVRDEDPRRAAAVWVRDEGARVQAPSVEEVEALALDGAGNRLLEVEG
jgi:hypothetical protein